MRGYVWGVVRGFVWSVVCESLYEGFYECYCTHGTWCGEMLYHRRKGRKGTPTRAAAVTNSLSIIIVIVVATWWFGKGTGREGYDYDRFWLG